MDCGRFHNLRRQFVGTDRFVVAHVHPEIVFGNFFRQQAKIFIVASWLWPGAARLRPVCDFSRSISGVGFCGGMNRNALNIERLAGLEALRILVVVGANLGQRDRGLIVHFGFENCSISNERVICCRSTCRDPCISACMYCSYSSGLLNCLRNSASAWFNLRGNCQPSALRLPGRRVLRR